MMANSDNREPLELTVPVAIKIVFLILRILALTTLSLVAFRTLIFMLANFSTVVAIERHGLKVLANLVLSWHP